MRISFTISLLLTLLVLTTAVIAQSKNEKKGDKQMAGYEFLSATESYTKALAEDNSAEGIKLKLAHCYIKLNQPEQIVHWYRQIIDKDDLVTPDDKFNYALALLSTGDINESKKWFSTYTEIVPSDTRSANYISQINDQAGLYRDSLLHNVKIVPFNSVASDFSPAFYKNGIVFVSGRTASKEVYKWNESGFLDLYNCQKGALDIYESPTLFQKHLNTAYHEGPICFYKDFKEMALTRNNFEKGKLRVSTDGVTRLKIYFASSGEDGPWSVIVPFAYNSDEYSVGHPAITNDGTTLYFISDLPGGFGGTDIYMSTFENNTWSKPQNLGATINTAGNEMFPFLALDKKLYFASNGRGGLGGLDIFEFDMTTGTIKNLGYPINSTKDDFGYIVNEKREGYFSSNRNTTNGNDDIYEFKSLKSFAIELRILVMTNTKNVPIPDARVMVTELSTDSTVVLQTDPDGYCKMPVVKNKEYSVTASKTGFSQIVKNILPARDPEKLLIRLDSNCLVIRGKVDFAKDANESDSVLVMLRNSVDGHQEEVWVNRQEYYQFCGNPTSVYQVKASKLGYFTKSVPLITEATGPMNVEDIMLEKIVIDKAITLDNIYYDLGKWNIRPDAAKELDKLVNMLENNPTIEIELSSHTDSRGSDASNLSLSQKRAASATEYIISKGIESTRVRSMGYGETNLINRCANGVPCTEGEHQANRRTEFKVLKF